MLMSRAGYNFCIIEYYRKRVFIVWFFQQIYFLGLFVGIWKALLIICKSLFNSLCDLHLPKTCEKRDVSSAKILQVDWMLSGKSLIYIRNKWAPRTEPLPLQILSTSKKRSDHEEEVFKSSPFARYLFNLKKPFVSYFIKSLENI